MSEQAGVTIEEMVKEVKRECAMRRKVYPRWVDLGKLKHSDALSQIRIMDAVVDELERRKQPELFQ